MRTHIFLGALVVCTPLVASPHICNVSEITHDKDEQTLPNSEKLHEKIGRKGFYEKQHATLKFTKRTSDDADLTRITLQWNGPRITQKAGVSGTLFKKTTEILIATHDNQVATGTWNEKNQQLSFAFKKPHPLSGTTKFSVVLTVNHELEDLLQNGSFSLVISDLPDAFQTTKKAITS